MQVGAPSSGQHGVHGGPLHLPVLQQDVELVEQTGSRSLLLLHQSLGCVLVKGDAKQLEGGLDAAEVALLGTGDARFFGIIIIIEMTVLTLFY